MTRTARPESIRLRRQELLALLLVALLTPALASAEEIWILVDTAVRRLDVYRGYTPIKRFRNISLGRNGPAPIHLAGDATTPLGEFRITHINHNSRFHIFLGLNYPTRAHMMRAHADGLVDTDTHDAFLAVLDSRKLPPQDTPLGGYIGIHGIGDGDPGIHARYDWTQGCIALTNEQIEELSRLVGVGTRVFIR